MALIRSFTRKNMERNSLHEEIDATYTIFERDGRIVLQSIAMEAPIAKYQERRAKASNSTGWGQRPSISY
jgi:hypothetical protein